MTTPEPVDARAASGAPEVLVEPGNPRASVPGWSRLGAMNEPQDVLASLVPEIRLLVVLITAAVIIAGLYFGREILIPLALALLLGFVLHPLVSWLKRLGLPLLAAVTLVVALSLGGVVLAGVALGHQVSSLSQQLPSYQSNIRKKLRDLRVTALGPGMFDGAVETLKVVKQEVEKAAAEETPGAGADRRAQAPTVQHVRIDPTPPSPFEHARSLIDAAIGPLATACIVLVFLFLVLLDRDDLRDRLLRLLGGSLHRSTDAMDEAGRRITKYLTMQLVVNLSYGIPMAAGLWLIGVPGALLWGSVASIIRFVPYVGPMIGAVAPIALAFAVDPGWDMVLLTVGLVVLLEVVSNNIVEPWLYGASTGLSAISLIAAATFWTAIWGPVGLILSTPLTVCLLVIGRHLPRLGFLDVLLGSQPALDAATRIYQRLLSGEVESALEVATEEVVEADVTAFYNVTALAVLRMATHDRSSVASAEHRHRLVVGMDALIDGMIEQHPPHASNTAATVVCIGGKWETDTLAARMLAHALSLGGLPATHRPSGLMTADYLERLDLADAKTVCLSFFSPEPKAAAQTFCRRLRRRWPDLRVVLALWNAPPDLLDEDARHELGADAVVTSLTEAVMQMAHTLGIDIEVGFLAAPVPENDATRVAALHDSGLLDGRAQPLLEAVSRRVADIFDVPIAMVSLIDAEQQRVPAHFWQPTQTDPDSSATMPRVRAEDLQVSRAESLCGHVVADGRTMVVPDLARDLRFAGNPTLSEKGLHFYAGAPLRDAQQHALGTLCILDVLPRSLTRRELELLESMAEELMAQLRAQVVAWGDLASVAPAATQPPSATVGQPLPSTS